MSTIQIFRQTVLSITFRMYCFQFCHFSDMHGYLQLCNFIFIALIFQLVDLALLVRQDMVAKAGDPFSHAISATFIQYHNSAEVSIKKSDRHICAFFYICSYLGKVIQEFMDFSQRILIHSTFKQILIEHLLYAYPNDPLNLISFSPFPCLFQLSQP